jgi:type IV pilus assembly protein PilM
MAFKLLKRDAGLVGIDFGYANIKVLQLSAAEDPQIARMGMIEFPDKIREDISARLSYAEEHLPRLINSLRLRSAKTAFSIPANLTAIQHVVVPKSEGAELEAQVRAQFAATVHCDLDQIVLRHIPVPSGQRRGSGQLEVICIAVGRDLVMRLVGLAKHCRMHVAAVHAEPLATIRAFDHITRRASDTELTTLYLDVGAGATKLVIAHGRELAFSKVITVAGHNFDERACQQVGGDIALARQHRLAMSMHANGGGTGATATAVAASPSRGGAASESLRAAPARADERRKGQLPPELHEVDEDVAAPDPLRIDLVELYETLTDEISMCIRYHQSSFPERRIDRAIFLGGESSQIDLCQFIAQRLRLRAHLGDPLARLTRQPSLITDGLPAAKAFPGWAVPLGLCLSPTDL